MFAEPQGSQPQRISEFFMDILSQRWNKLLETDAGIFLAVVCDCLTVTEQAGMMK